MKFSHLLQGLWAVAAHHLRNQIAVIRHSQRIAGERRCEMLARVTITEGSPAGIDEAIRFMREIVLPLPRKLRNS